MPEANILVVDDTADNLRLLIYMLGNQGYRVRPATGGVMAVTAAQREPPDLVLLDVMMPDMDGFEVCKALKADERTRDIPIIFLTALDTVTDKMKAFSEGGVDYITKPFQVEEVLARIKTHLTLRRLQQDLEAQNDRLREENLNRKRVQDALRESRERYRLLADYSTDMISRQSAEGLYLYVSPACTILLGYEVEEMMGRSLTELVHSEDLPAIQQFIDTAPTLPEVSTITYRARRQDNQYIWLETTNKLIRHPETGRIIEIIAVSRDVTERKQAEEALKALNRRMQEELTLAREIQQGLLPPPRPNWPDLDVACYSVPAYEVGGDFYRYYRLSSEDTSQKQYRYAFAIGDVSGKGVSAALLMAAVAAQFDASLNQKLRPAERLAYLDGAITPYTRPRRQNCGVCYLELEQDLVQGLITLHMSNAGGIAPYLKGSQSSVEQIEVGGFALGHGLGAEIGYQEVSRLLSSGDLIILASDGLIEAKKTTGEMFGFSRFEEAINRGPTTNAAAMAHHLQAAVMDFTQGTEPHDDITLLVIRV
jgi:PAS domain S-box-containing protein